MSALLRIFPSDKQARVMHTMVRLVLLSLFLTSCLPSLAPAIPTLTPSLTPTVTDTPTLAPTQTPWIITVPVEVTPPAFAASSLPEGTFIFSLVDGGYYHLFAYAPDGLPLTRLTNGMWDDITPALSPDGQWVAFSSRQNGYWDLYLLNLTSGGRLRLTDTFAYDAAPSWSPDGVWLVYETYGSESLEIAIRPVADPAAAPIPLTNDTFLDTAPVWSPRGRQIAFVSNRSGDPEVWLIDLDRAVGDLFVNISRSPKTLESHPAWSPDGTQLAWASFDPVTGLTSIQVWNALDPQAPPKTIGSGDWPVWMNATQLASRLRMPNETRLTAYDVPGNFVRLPPLLLPGHLQGLTYGRVSAPLPGVFAPLAEMTPTPLFVPTRSATVEVLPGRTALVPIEGTQAPYPQLSDAVDEAFAALRARVAELAGWDALASLENAFLPLTVPVDPGMVEDWLYTGRAFSLSPALIQAGWMVVAREDFGLQTWWRVYLRTLAQDGSQGQPLTQVPWDFDARMGSVRNYEEGGTWFTVPPGGYWLDLTDLAAMYGWERLPATTTWRTYYAGANFNKFVYRQGLTWRSAMLELYPPEAIMTPTLVIPPTRTPTRTWPWYRTPTPTQTSTPRPTATP